MSNRKRRQSDCRARRPAQRHRSRWLLWALGFPWAGVFLGVAASNAQPGDPPAPAIRSPHGSLKSGCETCHTAENWNTLRRPLAFSHDSTGFPLQGRHRGVACKGCHASLQFAHVATSCADCHRDVHEGRNGTSCQDCHTPERWVGRADALRQHASTGFPLRGMHALLECTRCHAAPGEASVAKLSSECASCHAADYAATQNPNHASAGYSTRCEECHDASRTTWGGAGFDHNTTGFALTGAHRALDCGQCHGSGGFGGTSASCFGCHEPEYEATTNPAHRTAGFAISCETCHSTSAWQPSTFDHGATGFALTGAHRAIECAACHEGGRYEGTPSDCDACHQSDYAATTNPDHAAASFGTDCTACHSTSAWQPSTFDHDRQYFRIFSGRHAGRWDNCAACHLNPGSYSSFSCIDCHEHSPSETDGQHREVGNYRYESNVCYSCHRNV